MREKHTHLRIVTLSHPPLAATISLCHFTPLPDPYRLTTCRLDLEGPACDFVCAMLNVNMVVEQRVGSTLLLGKEEDGSKF